jgi:ribosome biogenesis GTPase / thiamine phosphate phosphatase
MSFDLSSVGWDDTLARAYRRQFGPDHQPGRVSRVDRGVCSVLTADGAGRASLGGAVLAAAAADPTRLPCAGDWVVVRHWPDQRSTVESVLPRRTAIVRATAGKEALGQVLAANVDVAAVVAAVDPEPDLGRIERLLAVAWNSGAQPLIILTKADLATEPAAIVAEVAAVAPGIDVYAVSAVTGTGMDALRPLVGYGLTLGLLGSSGAGKSTLVNAFAGTPVMAVQAIRDADGKGRHTTTYRALIPIPGGGAVLDTPGLRGVGLVSTGGPGADPTPMLGRAFADIAELGRRCRFADCRHDGEPDCAVAEAIEAGVLAPRRIESWRTLQRELAHEARRQNARLASQAQPRWKYLSKRQRTGGHRP